MELQSAPLSPGRWKQHRDDKHPRKGHDLHGCSGSQQAYSLGVAWPWPDVRAPGKEPHRSAPEGKTRRHHRDPAVPGAQGDRGREGRRTGQTRGGRARRPWGGMVRIPGPGRGTHDAAPRSSQTSSGRSRRRNGWKPDNGLEVGPPGRNTGCQASRSQMVRLRVAPRGSPRGLLNWTKNQPTARC